MFKGIILWTRRLCSSCWYASSASCEYLLMSFWSSMNSFLYHSVLEGREAGEREKNTGSCGLNAWQFGTDFLGLVSWFLQVKQKALLSAFCSSVLHTKSTAKHVLHTIAQIQMSYMLFMSLSNTQKITSLPMTLASNHPQLSQRYLQMHERQVKPTLFFLWNFNIIHVKIMRLTIIDQVLQNYWSLKVHTVS